MNRNFRHTKPNTSKRGKGPQVNNRGRNSPGTFFDKPLHSSTTDHGNQRSDENPFSHLALEIDMNRPTVANPFDNGVMPSFDDRAIDEDYRNETAKKFGGDPFGRNHMDRHRPATRQSTMEMAIPPFVKNDVRPPLAQRIVKDVKAVTTAPTMTPVRESTIVHKVPDVDDELDLDDFTPRPPVMPSIDLKPQINIRSRGAIVPKEDAKSRFNAPIERKPIVQPAPVKPIVRPAPAKPVVQPAPVKQIYHPALAKAAPATKPAAATKPIIDYFGTQSSNEPKQEVDPKEECFRESQIEANKMLFGVAEPTRPLTNVEVSKRKKLILKLVDQKLKQKLTELMNQMSGRAENQSTGGEPNDSFADQLENLVPDSIPDNANPEHTQNWTAYPSEASEQAWNNFPPQTEIPSNPNDGPWPVRPPYQQGPGWLGQPMNLYPPGVDPNLNNRFPRMPPMRPPWNESPWQPHMRPPDLQWQPQHNWNMPGRPMNPHLMQPHINSFAQPDLAPFPVPPVVQLPVEKPAAEIELELKEKEFLERTLMGTKSGAKRKESESHRRNSPPQKTRRRSPPRRSSRDRERDRRRSPRSRYENRSPRSPERFVHRNVELSQLSPVAVSPSGPFRSRSASMEDFRELMYDDHFEPPPMLHYESRSRSRDSRSEDLRVRLSKRRNMNRSRSPADLRNRLTDNRQGRNDDLRHQLAERSTSTSKRSRSSRSSRSRSRGRSSKKMDKPDADDTEWQKFNNIVGMLMNIERDAELSAEEMVERKEIMRLLLENPDLLELDDKFVYKFGKGRLNLAVKEAENILYPNGVPNEHIASLISKKIAALPTEKKPTVAKDTIPIEWIKLGNIIDQMLRLTMDERKNLATNEKRMLERDELLLKISDDPDSVLKLGTKYGHRNVEWACKFAYKILYRNGVRDKRVDQTIAKERKRAIERIAATKKSRNSTESHQSGGSDGRAANSSEWNRLAVLVTKLVKSSLEKFEKMTRDDNRRRDDLLVQMSRDPESIRSDTKFTDNIDKAVVEDTIKKCKEIIAAVKSHGDKSVITEFEYQRTKLINALHFRAQRTTAHDQILFRISSIFGNKQERWTADEKKEREALAEALIKEPESLRTNTKALERIGDDKLVVDEIIADVKQILAQLDPSRARGPKKFHISHTKVIDIPFVVKIEDAADLLDDTTKTVLLRALREMITEIENPPKPKLLQQRYIDRRVEVVCANLLTFEWLKRAIATDFKDKWAGADLKIERVPVAIQIPRDKLKSVDVVFKDSRATLPFDEIVRELRRENPKLYPERWELLDGRGKNGDYKKKTVGIDIESLAALEQMNRFARLGRSLIYFDISYMGDNVPNFEATCQ